MRLTFAHEKGAAVDTAAIHKALQLPSVGAVHHRHLRCARGEACIDIDFYAGTLASDIAAAQKACTSFGAPSLSLVHSDPGVFVERIIR
jgi:hypothetical protein